MATRQADFHRRVQRLFESGCVGRLTDAELLARFVVRRDEHAFEALVLRHGPLVHRVCRGVLHDGHAAEDAFQATFLVLALKAGGLRVGASLSGWLHGVALRVATKARSQNAKRLRRESQVAADQAWEPDDDPDWSDARALLHEEVDRLPESYRTPIILCYLQGLSYEIAADRLGVSEGAVRGRLARARDRLRVRLTRRGVVVPASLLAAGEAWTSATAATLPVGLAERAVRAAMSTIGVKGAVVGAVAAPVVVLTKGVLRTMFLTQLRMGATALALAIGGLASATAFLADRNVNGSAPGSPALSAEQQEHSRSDSALLEGASKDDPGPRPRDAAEKGKLADEPALGIDVKPRPWETVVRVSVRGDGSISFGSGTVIRSTREESLILTCAHIFKLETTQELSPQSYRNAVSVDLFDGILDKTRAQVRYVETLTAEVVDFDLQSNLGLLRIRPGRILQAAPMIPSSWKPRAGMRMLTAGCSQGADATIWPTRILKSNVLLFSHSSYQAIECENAPQQGRKGGGLFTLEGDLAGVCNYAEPRGNRGYYATPELIHRFLVRNRLALLDPDEKAPPTNDSTHARTIDPFSPVPVASDTDFDPWIRAGEDQLKNGDREGARATVDRLNGQLGKRREALEAQLRYLDALSRRIDQLRDAARRDHPFERGQEKPVPSPPASTRHRPGSLPSNSGSTPDPDPADQERRLRDIEEKLERLIEERKETGKSTS